MHGPNVNLVLRSLDRLADRMAQLPARHGSSSPKGPGRIDLTDTEWVMYQTVADYNADDFADATKILSYLHARLGYQRLQPGVRVTVNFRPHGSDVLLKPFDGKYANVLAVDQHGRAWVQFADADWRRAVQLGHAHSSSAATGTSPYEATIYETVDPKKRALRLDPLDTKEYRTQMAKLGFQLPATQKLRVADETSVPVPPPSCPQCSQPMIYKRGRDGGTDGYVCEACTVAAAEKTADPIPYFDSKSDNSSGSSDSSSSSDDGADDESDGYFYDPLVRDLPDASREQYLYVVKNLSDSGMPGPGGDWSPHEEHVLQASLGEIMQSAQLREIDQLLLRQAKAAKPVTDDTSKPPSPHMKKKIKEKGPSDERGPTNLTGHGAKLWEKMFTVPHIKEYVESAINPGHAWARAFSSFMAYSQHHHEKKGKFTPVMEGWDEDRHHGWHKQGGAMRVRKHAKRLKAIKEHFKTVEHGKLPTEVSGPGKQGPPTTVQKPGSSSKWVRVIRKRDGKIVQVRRGKETNKAKYAPVTDQTKKKYQKAAGTRSLSWAW